MYPTLFAIGLVINEITASNIDGSLSPATNFDSWIEIYNPTDSEVDLAGMYLSNEQDNPTRWRMPSDVGTVAANGFKVIWLGSNNIKPQQAPFSLDCDGGVILLSDKEGNLVAKESYPEALSRTSWARTTNGGEEWAWTARPTPNSSNNNSAFYSKRLEAPVVDTDSRTFTDSLVIKVDIPEGCTLHYTIGGGLPTSSSPVSKTGRIKLRQSMDFRFRLYKDGYLPSVPVTRSYIKTSDKYTIPIISIVGDKRYFEDNYMGIAVNGTNGRPGNGSSEKRNWNMDWERPVNFSMILPDGTMAINQDVQISVSGGWTRASSTKAYKLKAGKEFDGQNDLPYPFFSQKPHIRNKNLLLRAGGNDNNGRFKDPALQTIIWRSGIDLDVQSYEPVIEYINGVCKGIINLREPNNKRFAEANFGYNDEELDVFEMSCDSNVYMMCGSAETLERIYELGEQAGNPTVYEELEQLIDMDEYVNYMAMQLYLCSTDWPYNNMKGYRSQNNGRYRFVTFDLDFAFNTNDPFNFFASHQWHTFNYLYDLGETRHEEIKLVTLFFNLLGNEQFRRQFIDTYCIMAGSVFEYNRAEAIIRELANRVRPMMQLQNMSPDGSMNSLLNGFNGHATNMMNRIQQFDRMNLSDSERYTTQIDADVPDARIYINDIRIPYNDFKGELFPPVTLKAEAPGGYRFAGWKRNMEQGGYVIIAANDTWKYFDRGQLAGTAWRKNNYAETAWSQGKAPLGYGRSGINTTLSYGSDASNKRPTYYLRHTFTLDKAPTSDDLMKLNYRVDDAAVIYVNGVEAGRINLPEGNISYTTYSTTLVEGTPQSGTLNIPSSLFQAGSNVIAVEVHNYNASSSDIFWEGQLVLSSLSEKELYFTTEPEFTMPETSGQHFTACFIPLTEEERQEHGMTPIRINEVSAANEIATNEYWKRGDWVELYNTTDTDIDVAGMYLSDNANKPQKYCITAEDTGASTIVPAHGYLTIWCDKLNTMDYLHASFKLDDEGGVVMLTSADGAWNDILTYPAHNSDQTVGRYPDGSNTVYQLTLPTFGQTNQRSSYALMLHEEPGNGTISAVAKVQKDTTPTLRYIQGELILLGADKFIGSVITVHSVAGHEVTRLMVGLALYDRASVPLSLPPGCYIATIQAVDGTKITCKFIV